MDVTDDTLHPVADWGARVRFGAAFLAAFLWTMFCVWLSARWVEDLGRLTHPLAALWAITFIAYVPGFMNAFLLASLLLDRRAAREQRAFYPGITVLVAAYQEEDAIGHTLASLAASRYPGELEVLIVNDGSTDRTSQVARAALESLSFPQGASVEVLDFAANRGKAAALNSGLARARHELIVTIDGDTALHESALTHIVERLLSDPNGTAAVAGAVLVGNARENLTTGAQEWDYFHGIAAVKRMQSMYHGTLVAQGAFAIYRKSALQAVGGWPETVGEDIVLTWALLRKGWRVGYAEDAVVFTHAPATIRQLAQQRKRWARGMIEALAHHEALLFKGRLSTMFIWWNLLFLPLDFTFTFVFLPGLAAACFGIFWVAGPMTLAVLPLAALWNIVIYRIQSRMADKQDLALRHNFGGLVFYVLVYTLVMQPISVWGYAAEIAGLKKRWGTK